jgi:hypothetical protein
MGSGIERMQEVNAKELAIDIAESFTDWMGPSWPMCGAQNATNKLAEITEKRLSVFESEKPDVWISVKDRLPVSGNPKDENLGWIVYKPRAIEKKVETTYVHPDWWRLDEGTTQEITHWQPFPEPPKTATTS